LAKYGTEGKTARQKGAQKRKSTPRTRSQGLRLMEYWVRNPRLRAAIREEAALLALHPSNADIDDWIDAATDKSK
jgi:hypothetical protein